VVEVLSLLKLSSSLRDKVLLNLSAGCTKHLNSGYSNNGFLVLALIRLELSLLKLEVGDEVSLFGLLVGKPLPSEELALHLERHLFELS
jgi:hypothetical protein